MENSSEIVVVTVNIGGSLLATSATLVWQRPPPPMAPVSDKPSSICRL